MENRDRGNEKKTIYNRVFYSYNFTGISRTNRTELSFMFCGSHPAFLRHENKLQLLTLIRIELNIGQMWRYVWLEFKVQFEFQGPKINRRLSFLNN